MDAPIELKCYLDNPTSEEAIAECKRVAQIFQKTGALALRDPRVSFADNNAFLDLVEKYFEQNPEVKKKDARPELHYQVGVTPEGVEKPRCTFDANCQKIVHTLEGENKPRMPTEADVKWRFFHKLGERPTNTSFASLNSENVIPDAFRDNWVPTMESWGKKLLEAGITLSEMAAIGFGLPKNTFTDLLKFGPHLLAPTASDLNKYGKLGQILAGFHQDLNFVTLHGKSRFSGLYIWLRNGTKMPVAIPDGCLLAQAGMQFEYLTGGAVVAGYHEVVVNEKTLEAVARARQNSTSMWRISSTVFVHVASDQHLRPLIQITSEENVLQSIAVANEDNNNSNNNNNSKEGGTSGRKKEYPPILAGDFVSNELKVIKLGS
jgi:isopenicillin N synthase-like dioxygenase